MQEYVIAHGVHMPNITEKNTFVEDIVRVDLNMGPGVAVTGDIIWDQTQTSNMQTDRLQVHLEMYLSLSANPPIVDRDADQQKNMDELRDQLENAKTFEMTQQEKEFVDLTKEVEDLRKYKKENEKKLKQPKNLQNVDIEEKKQLDKAKTHFEQKNIEIEELLENLRKMGTDGKGLLAPDALNSDQI